MQADRQTDSQSVRQTDSYYPSFLLHPHPPFFSRSCCALQLLRAEMEEKRLRNIVQHHDEIMARPARQWIQTAEVKAFALFVQHQLGNKDTDACAAKCAFPHRQTDRHARTHAHTHTQTHRHTDTDTHTGHARLRCAEAHRVEEVLSIMGEEHLTHTPCSCCNLLCETEGRGVRS